MSATAERIPLADAALPALTYAQQVRLWGWIDRRYGELDPRDPEQVREAWGRITGPDEARRVFGEQRYMAGTIRS